MYQDLECVLKMQLDRRESSLFAEALSVFRSLSDLAILLFGCQAADLSFSVAVDWLLHYGRRNIRHLQAFVYNRVKNGHVQEKKGVAPINCTFTKLLIASKMKNANFIL